MKLALLTAALDRMVYFPLSLGRLVYRDSGRRSSPIAASDELSAGADEEDAATTWCFGLGMSESLAILGGYDGCDGRWLRLRLLQWRGREQRLRWLRWLGLYLFCGFRLRVAVALDGRHAPRLLGEV